jgi:hypothetical protein
MAFLVLLTAWPLLPASAQSTLQPPDVRQASGPNADAAQRPKGPNARVAERPATGPNTELLRTNQPPDQQAYFPNCAAAGAARALPVRRGEPGYGRHLDRDGDGVACE